MGGGQVPFGLPPFLPFARAAAALAALFDLPPLRPCVASQERSAAGGRRGIYAASDTAAPFPWFLPPQEHSHRKPLAARHFGPHWCSEGLFLRWILRVACTRTPSGVSPEKCGAFVLMCPSWLTLESRTVCPLISAKYRKSAINRD